MSFPIHADPVPLRVTSDGAARIAATRVLLDLVVQAFDEGATPETIVQQYPSLQLVDVYAVIAYCLRHRADVDAYLAERERLAGEVKAKIQAAQGDQRDLRARLLARRADQEDSHAAAGR